VGLTDQQACQTLLEIAREYDALAHRALQRLAVAQEQQQILPKASWRHRIEPSASGGFIAFWENQAVYAKGHMRKFPTQAAARLFLARCDTVGKIIHEI